MAAAFVMAMGMAGSASAQVGSTCPTNTSSGQTAPSGIQLNQLDGAVGSLYADATGARVGGELDTVLPNSYGEADVGVNEAGNVATYDGELNGDSTNDDSTLGYGDLQGEVGGGGVNGSADGSTAGGVAEAEGSVNQGSTLNSEFDVAGTCVSIDVP